MNGPISRQIVQEPTCSSTPLAECPVCQCPCPAQRFLQQKLGNTRSIRIAPPPKRPQPTGLNLTSWHLRFTPRTTINALLTMDLRFDFRRWDSEAVFVLFMSKTLLESRL